MVALPRERWIEDQTAALPGTPEEVATESVTAVSRILLVRATAALLAAPERAAVLLGQAVRAALPASGEEVPEEADRVVAAVDDADSSQEGGTTQ